MSAASSSAAATDTFGGRARILVSQLFSSTPEGKPTPGSFFFSSTDAAAQAGPITIAGFVLLGLFLSFHLSQCIGEIPIEWAVLRKDNRYVQLMHLFRCHGSQVGWQSCHPPDR